MAQNCARMVPGARRL